MRNCFLLLALLAVFGCSKPSETEMILTKEISGLVQQAKKSEPALKEFMQAFDKFGQKYASEKIWQKEDVKKLLSLLKTYQCPFAEREKIHIKIEQAIGINPSFDTVNLWDMPRCPIFEYYSGVKTLIVNANKFDKSFSKEISLTALGMLKTNLDSYPFFIDAALALDILCKLIDQEILTVSDQIFIETMRLRNDIRAIRERIKDKRKDAPMSSIFPSRELSKNQMRRLNEGLLFELKEVAIFSEALLRIVNRVERANKL